MNHPLSSTDGVLHDLSRQAKRRYLTVLSDLVWDIEAELAQVKGARAELMNSLQSDMRTGSMIR